MLGLRGREVAVVGESDWSGCRPLRQSCLPRAGGWAVASLCVASPGCARPCYACSWPDPPLSDAEIPAALGMLIGSVGPGWMRCLDCVGAA
jgi:hypothetical protein